MLLSHALLTFALVVATATSSSPEVPATGTEVQVDCTNETNNSTLWEEYVCHLRDGPDLQERCQPIYFLSNAIENKKSLGLIVGFHGYTACPDSFSSMTKAWLDAGYDVMIPLLPGQGRDPGDCADPSTQDSQDITICVEGNRIDGLPLTRQGYIDWADHVNAIVLDESIRRRELNQIFAAGLSHGGPLASYVVNTASTKLYDGYISMNAFYGFSSPDVDRQFEKCTVGELSSEDCAGLLTEQLASSFDVGLAPGAFLQVVEKLIQDALQDQYSAYNYAALNAAIRRAMTELAENFDKLPDDVGDFKSSLNEGTLSWGPPCLIENENGRGGICAFRLRNLFATHSFAQYAHRLSGRYTSRQAPVQLVGTERDAGARLSMNVQMAQNVIRSQNQGVGNGSTGAGEQKVNFCIFRLDPDCDLAKGGNRCGVPHSMLSRAENNLKGDLYWEEGVQEDSLLYFDRRLAMGTLATTLDDFTETKDCVQLAVSDPDARTSILPPFRGLWLHLSFDVGLIAPEQQAGTAELLYDMFELNGGLVIPSNVEVLLEDCNGSPTPYQEFYLEFPADLVTENDVKDVEEMITAGALDGVTGSTVFGLEVSGRRPVVLGSPCN